MIRDLGEDFAVLQSGYWRVEADLARPRIVSLRIDPHVRGTFLCQPGGPRALISRSVRYLVSFLTCAPRAASSVLRNGA